MPRRNKVIGSILIVSTVLAVGTAAVVFYLVGIKDWLDRREFLSETRWAEQDRGRIVFIGLVGWGSINEAESAIYPATGALFELELPDGEFRLLSDTANLELDPFGSPIFDPVDGTFLVETKWPQPGLARVNPASGIGERPIQLPCSGKGYFSVPMRDTVDWSYRSELRRLCQDFRGVDIGRESRRLYTIRYTETVEDIRPHLNRIDRLRLVKPFEGTDSLQDIIHRMDTSSAELVVYAPNGEQIAMDLLPEGYYRGLAVSPDESWIATSVCNSDSYNDQLLFYNMETESTAWPAFGDFEMSLPVFSSYGNRLAVCGRDTLTNERAILISENPDFMKFEAFHRFTEDFPSAVAWSPDDKWIMVTVGRSLRGFGRPALMLFETATGKSTYVRYSAFFESSVRPQVFPEDDLIWIP